MGAPSLQAEVDNPQIIVSGEAKVIIKNGGGEPEEEGESKCQTHRIKVE